MRLSSLLLLALPACIGMKVGNGVPGTRSETFPSASGFRLTNMVEVELTVRPGEPATVELNCDESLLDDFRIEVVGGGVLVLGDRVGVSPSPRTDCTAVVTVPELTSLTISGSGSIDLDTADGLEEVDSSGSGGITIGAVSAGSLDVNHSGSGRVAIDGIDATSLEVDASGSGRTSLTGDVDEADLSVSGSGGLGETGLVICDLTLHVSGSGGAEVTARESAVVNVSGSGGATIHGDPEIRDTHSSGSGGIHFE